MSREPFTYTNWRGVPYYVHAAKTKHGRTRYMAKRSPDGALRDLPDGYEIAENVNGQVSVRKAKPRHILPLEEQLAEWMLKSYGRGEYRVEIKGRHIVIHEPNSDVDEIVEMMHSPDGMLDALLGNAIDNKFGPGAWQELRRRRMADTREQMQKNMRYSPVLRLCLEEPTKRLYGVERMCYIGDEGWLWLAGDLPLPEALERYVPLLGTEELFEHC